MNRLLCPHSRGSMRTFPDMDPSKADRPRVPKSLKKLLDKSCLRYGVVIYSYGYVQAKKGYQKEKVEKATSKVIDGETDRVVHFVNETPTFASHPGENSYVSELLHKLLKEFMR